MATRTTTGPRHLLTREIDDDFAVHLLTLAQLRAETLLTMPDCCVLLGALDQQARLASFDDRLIQAAQARGLDVADS